MIQRTGEPLVDYYCMTMRGTGMATSAALGCTPSDVYVAAPPTWFAVLNALAVHINTLQRR